MATPREEFHASSRKEREESFRIEGGLLIRSVIPARGREPYEHSCEQAVYEEVAHTITEREGESFTMEDIRAATGHPWTQVAVAMAFLKERGCIVPSIRRKHNAAGDDVHLDAMIEWHALREKPAEA